MILFVILSTITSYDWTKVDQLINKALDQRVFPAAILAVASSKQVYYAKPYGVYTYGQGAFDPAVTLDSKFDLASMTKILGTTTAIMRLYDQNRIDTDDLVTKYFPQYDNNFKRNTTLKNLLLHNSGLPPVSPFNYTAQQIWEYIIYCKLDSPVGTRYKYSDLGFILLGKIVQKITKKTIDKYLYEIFIGLGMKDIGYNPSPSQFHLTVPTQYDHIFRKRLVRGECHDQKCLVMGGVAGHAGLFSNANDIIKYMRILINNGTAYGQKLPKFEASTVKKFTTKQINLPYKNSRALGFDTVPIQQHPPCGFKFSQNSFGHTGFTGTMTWADKQKDIVIVFLTNAVNPNRNANRIIPFRTKLSDQVTTTLGY